MLSLMPAMGVLLLVSLPLGFPESEVSEESFTTNYKFMQMKITILYSPLNTYSFWTALINQTLNPAQIFFCVMYFYSVIKFCCCLTPVSLTAQQQHLRKFFCLDENKMQVNIYRLLKSRLFCSGQRLK